MLGDLLEIAIETNEIASAFAALRDLGFAAVDVGDIRTSAYAVVSDGTLSIGLHGQLDSPMSLTFVRPDLEHYVRALGRRGIAPAFARLGEQEFHELGFTDPNGQLVSLVEARTFPPVSAAQIAPSICGKFLEFSLCTSALEESQAFWAALGLAPLAAGEEPYPWRRLAGAGLTLGLHQAPRFEPGLSFAASQLSARIEFLRAKGIPVDRRGPPFADARDAATISVLDTLPIYLLSAPEDAD